MGGFLGIGESAEEKQLKEQNKLRKAEVDKARKDAEIRLAERKAKKGSATANIKIGTSETDLEEEEETTTGSKSAGVSSSLGLNIKKNKTGVQL